MFILIKYSQFMDIDNLLIREFLKKAASLKKGWWKPSRNVAIFLYRLELQMEKSGGRIRLDSKLSFLAQLLCVRWYQEEIILWRWRPEKEVMRCNRKSCQLFYNVLKDCWQGSWRFLSEPFGWFSTAPWLGYPIGLSLFPRSIYKILLVSVKSFVKIELIKNAHTKHCQGSVSWIILERAMEDESNRGW